MKPFSTTTALICFVLFLAAPVAATASSKQDKNARSSPMLTDQQKLELFCQAEPTDVRCGNTGKEQVTKKKKKQKG